MAYVAWIASELGIRSRLSQGKYHTAEALNLTRVGVSWPRVRIVPHHLLLRSDLSHTILMRKKDVALAVVFSRVIVIVFCLSF
jgi:hypothetical protein